MLKSFGDMGANKGSKIRINHSCLFQPELLPPWAQSNSYCDTVRGEQSLNIEDGGREASQLQGSLRPLCPVYFSHTRTGYKPASQRDTASVSQEFSRDGSAPRTPEQWPLFGCKGPEGGSLEGSARCPDHRASQCRPCLRNIDIREQNVSRSLRKRRFTGQMYVKLNTGIKKSQVVNLQDLRNI